MFKVFEFCMYLLVELFTTNFVLDLAARYVPLFGKIYHTILKKKSTNFLKNCITRILVKTYVFGTTGLKLLLAKEQIVKK